MDIDHRSVRSGNYHTLTLATPVAMGKEPTDYNVLSNKPSINGIELIGDMTLSDLGLNKVPTDVLTPEDLEDIFEE